MTRLALKKAAERRREEPGRVDELEAEVTKLKAEARRLAESIATGDAPASIVDVIRDKEQRLKLKEEVLAELKLPEVTDLNQFSLNHQVRENLARFREVITDKHVPRARQALRKLLGDNTLWFEPMNGGYRLTGETRLGPLFDENSVGGAGRET